MREEKKIERVNQMRLLNNFAIAEFMSTKLVEPTECNEMKSSIPFLLFCFWVEKSLDDDFTINVDGIGLKKEQGTVSIPKPHTVRHPFDVCVCVCDTPWRTHQDESVKTYTFTYLNFSCLL